MGLLKKIVVCQFQLWVLYHLDRFQNHDLQFLQVLNFHLSRLWSNLDDYWLFDACLKTYHRMLFFNLCPPMDRSQKTSNFEKKGHIQKKTHQKIFKHYFSAIKYFRTLIQLQHTNICLNNIQKKIGHYRSYMRPPNGSD